MSCALSIEELSRERSHRAPQIGRPGMTLKACPACICDNRDDSLLERIAAA